MKERIDYYRVIEQTQRSTLDVTDWLVWFLDCFSRAIDSAEDAYAAIPCKAGLWQRHAHVTMNSRQQRVLNRCPDGFEGKLTARKWAAIGKCSIPTAQRDINQLLELGILLRNPGGSKKTSYRLAMEPMLPAA